jgi:hypothetical protein
MLRVCSSTLGCEMSWIAKILSLLLPKKPASRDLEEEAEELSRFILEQGHVGLPPPAID